MSGLGSQWQLGLDSAAKSDWNDYAADMRALGGADAWALSQGYTAWFAVNQRRRTWPRGSQGDLVALLVPPAAAANGPRPTTLTDAFTGDGLALWYGDLSADVTQSFRALLYVGRPVAPTRSTSAKPFHAATRQEVVSGSTYWEATAILDDPGLWFADYVPVVGRRCSLRVALVLDDGTLCRSGTFSAVVGGV